MRRYVALSSRFLVIAFALTFATQLLAEVCPETKPARYVGPIAPDGPLIASQCPEACPTLGSTPYYLDYNDDHYGDLDIVFAECRTSDGTAVSWPEIPSNFGDCWRCLETCAGAACPPGELCIPNPNAKGSDCERWTCDDPGYDPVESRDGDKITVICRLHPLALCPIPTIDCTLTSVTLDGPTQIQPGATCMWSAGVSTSYCNDSRYDYEWYAANQWVGSGQDYSGGKPANVPNGYPWKLRVEVTIDGRDVGIYEIEVRESANAPVCFY